MQQGGVCGHAGEGGGVIGGVGEEEDGGAHCTSLALSDRFLLHQDRAVIVILVVGHRPERMPPLMMGRPERGEDVYTEGGCRLERRRSDILQLRVGRGVGMQMPISIQRACSLCGVKHMARVGGVPPATASHMVQWHIEVASP